MSAEIAAKAVLDTEVPMSEFIPYSRHITDTIVGTHTGDMLTVFKLGGRSHLSADYQTLMQWVRDLNTVFKGAASDSLAIWAHVGRRKVTEYPTAIYDNAFCGAFDRKYRGLFTDKSLKVNELYVTVIRRAVADKTLRFFAKFERPDVKARNAQRAGMLKDLEELQRLFLSSLKRYSPEILSTYKCVNLPPPADSEDGVPLRVELEDWWESVRLNHPRQAGDNRPELVRAEEAAEAVGLTAHVYSRPLEFLGSLVNGERLPVPVTWEHFSKTIPQNRVSFSTWGELGEIRMPNRTRYFGMVEIFDYEKKTEPGHLNALLKAPYEFVLTQSFTLLSRYAAKGLLEKAHQGLVDSNDASETQIAELEFALDQLMAGEFAFGEHHATVTVFGDTAEETRNSLEKARSTFFEVAIVPQVVDLALEAAFWAQLPANWKWRPRPAPISSQNFLCLSSFHNYMAGKPAGNPWGPAVTIFKTDAGTPYYFNFHSTDLDEDSQGERPAGHFGVIGATGQGKTVLLGALLAQADKFRPRVVVFDKDRGLQILVTAMGGKYLPLAIGQPTGMNPLQLDPTPENMIFLKGLIKQLATSSGEPVNHRDEVEIDTALDTVMNRLDKRLRNLTTLLQSLPNPIGNEDQRPTVSARLRKWTRGHDLGWLFDNQIDEIDLAEHRIYGFDYTEFLDAPEIRTPLMMYLLYRTDEMVDGQPNITLMDEFWKPLQDPVFQGKVKDNLKTRRKFNALGGYATQEPGDALESPIARTIISQCATLILLPNPSGNRADYVDGLKLTDAEFDLVMSLPTDSRKFVIKQGGSCAVCSMNLDGFGDELLLFSGSPDRAELMEEVIADVGSDPERWIPAFVSRVKSKEKPQ